MCSSKEQDVESVSELKILLDRGRLQSALQHDMIISMIEDAFENYDTLDLESEDTSKEDVPQTKEALASSAQIKQQTQSPSELPPHKSFGAFISHKKVRGNLVTVISMH
jgi:hypothetical protein